jgi:hypothetical protein
LAIEDGDDLLSNPVSRGKRGQRLTLSAFTADPHCMWQSTRVPPKRPLRKVGFLGINSRGQALHHSDTNEIEGENKYPFEREREIFAFALLGERRAISRRTLLATASKILL